MHTCVYIQLCHMHIWYMRIILLILHMYCPSGHVLHMCVRICTMFLLLLVQLFVTYDLGRFETVRPYLIVLVPSITATPFGCLNLYHAMRRPARRLSTWFYQNFEECASEVDCDYAELVSEGASTHRAPRSLGLIPNNITRYRSVGEVPE